MVSIATIKRINMQVVEAIAAFYVQVIFAGQIYLNGLAYFILNQITIWRSDCLTVPIAMQHNFIETLLQGRNVPLGAQDHFQIGIRSEGKELAEEVSTFMVKSAHINFPSGKRLHTMLKFVNYNLVAG